MSGIIAAGLLLSFFAAACATTGGSGLTSAQLKAQGVDEGAFRRGRALSVTECAECHRLYRPSEYSPEEWGPISRKMGARASLGKDQIADMELYFVTASRARIEMMK
jgi:hypothetical protein